MSVGQIARKRPDPCSFVIFGVTGDLAHRLVVPALYNLAASDLLPDKFCLVGIARKGLTSDEAARQPDEGLARVRDPAGGRCDRAAPAVMRHLHRSRSERSGLVRRHEQAAYRARSRAGDRRQSPVLPRDAAECVPADQPRTRPHRHAGRERRVAAAGGRKAVRHRSGIGQGAEQRVAQARRRAPDLPDRSLSRQGDGAEHPGAALCQRHVRADLESQSHRSRADHGRRDSSASAIAAASTTRPARCATWCRTICFNCCRWSRWSRRSGSMRIRCVRKRPTCSPRSSRRARSRRCAIPCAGNIAAARSATRISRIIAHIEDVAPGSTTETYVALKLIIDNWRWAGVPFYLRTGKALGVKRTEVAIKFKQAPFAMFSARRWKNWRRITS